MAAPGSAASSKNYAYPAEMLINAGAHYVVLDFIAIRAANGDLRVMAEQCAAPSPGPIGTRRVSVAIRNGSISAAIPWAVISAAWRSSPIGGRNLACRRPSSKAAPASGMYDMKPVRLSKRGNYVHFNDEMEQAMSSQRHLDLIRAPVVVTYGTNETPEFQRQNRDFAAALKAAGKPIELIEAANYNHFEMVESVGNPYGPNGRAVLAMMKLNAA